MAAKSTLKNGKEIYYDWNIQAWRYCKTKKIYKRIKASKVK